MKQTHLDDEYIQMLVLKELKIDSAQENHLKDCTRCAQKVRSYRTLMLQLGELDEPIVSFDIQGLVMNKVLKNDKSPSPIFPFSVYALLFIIACVIVYSFRIIGAEVMDLLSSTFNVLTFIVIPLSIMMMTVIVIQLIKDFQNKMKILNYSV